MPAILNRPIGGGPFQIKLKLTLVKKTERKERHEEKKNKMNGRKVDETRSKIER